MTQCFINGRPLADWDPADLKAGMTVTFIEEIGGDDQFKPVPKTPPMLFTTRAEFIQQLAMRHMRGFAGHTPRVWGSEGRAQADLQVLEGGGVPSKGERPQLRVI